MSRAQVPGRRLQWVHAGRAQRQWALAASLGAALLLSGCGTPALDSDAAASFQASVREIATAAAAGDQVAATQLATELRQEVTVARGQGTVTSERATQIQSTIDELLLAIAAEVGQTGPIEPAPVPEPTTNTPAPLPATPAETPTPPAGPSQDDDGGDSEDEDSGDDDGGDDVGEDSEDADPAADKAQRDAEREREKQQREQEKLEKEQPEQAEREQAEREQEQGGVADDDG